MKNLLSIAVLSATLAIGASAHATEYVVNGDFTQLSDGVGQLNTNTVATGWTVPDGGYTFVFKQADVSSPGQYGDLSLWDAANGGSNTWDGLAAGAGNFAALDGAFQMQPLQQTITGLTVGQKYNFSFSYAFGQQNGFDGRTVQSLDASLGGLSGNSGDVNVGNHGFTGWQTVHVQVTATDTSELLSFFAHGDLPVPPFALVSNVSLTSSVPEPAAWTMMLVGLGAMGAIARRRRAMSGAAA